MLLTGFCLGCLSILFMIVARDFRSLPVAKVFLLLLLATIIFSLRDVVPSAWRGLVEDVYTCIPAIFWVLCQLGFARKTNLVSIWSFLALYSSVVPALVRAYGVDGSSTGSVYVYFWQLPQLAEYAVMLNGLWIVVSCWKDDLIESRRRMRGFLLVSVGVTSFWTTISMNTGYSTLIDLSAFISVTALVAAYLLLKGREGALFGAMQGITPSETPLERDDLAEEPSVEKTDADVLAQNLIDLMGSGYFRTEKLTLRKLSQELDQAEHKVRAMINQTFGFRNFNDYINCLRIAEASERLLNEKETPIQNIALDVGYRTLSSFNRAFKDTHSLTPSAYRSKDK